jgi:hypothetical protein
MKLPDFLHDLRQRITKFEMRQAFLRKPYRIMVLPKLLDESYILERACHTWVNSFDFLGLFAAFANSRNSR